MIYTLTLNPSLDYIVSVKDFSFGKTNRSVSEKLIPAGKGINVSLMLKNLTLDSMALGFIAGFTGDKIISDLDDIGIKHKFIHLDKSYSRINIKLENFDGTEINAVGPNVDNPSLEKLFLQLDNLKKGDYLILSGNIPQSLSSNLYADILEKYKNVGINFIVDACKDSLISALQFEPFLIKPNKAELSEIFQIEINSLDDVKKYAFKLKDIGAQNVLVSLGKNGALLVDKNGQQYFANVAKGKLVNAVGSGDCMIAGFIYEWLKSLDYENAFRMAVACGCASAYTDWFADKQQVECIKNDILVCRTF